MNRLIRSMISTIGMSRISGRISALNSMKINKARSTIYTTDHILEKSRNFGDMDLADDLKALFAPHICSRSHSLPFLLLICRSPCIAISILCPRAIKSSPARRHNCIPQYKHYENYTTNTALRKVYMPIRAQSTQPKSCQLNQSDINQPNRKAEITSVIKTAAQMDQSPSGQQL